MKVRQTVTNLDAYSRKDLMTEIFWHPYITMPTTSKRGSIGRLGSLVNESSRVKMYIRSEQLDNKRNGRRVRDERPKSILFYKPGTQIEVVILCPVNDL